MTWPGRGHEVAAVEAVHRILILFAAQREDAWAIVARRPNES